MKMPIATNVARIAIAMKWNQGGTGRTPRCERLMKEGSDQVRRRAKLSRNPMWIGSRLFVEVGASVWVLRVLWRRGRGGWVRGCRGDDEATPTPLGLRG